MATATSDGIDVSSFQSAQPWRELATSLTFAFAKASEGQRTRDPRFITHITGIIGAGLIPGAYHFAWPNQPAGAEAANYIATVRPYARRGFVHALDLERRTDGANYAGANAAEIRAYATAWITAVKAAFPGQRVGVYTSGADLDAGHYPANSDFLWHPAYPAGAMSYTQAAARTRPAPGGRQPLFWQFTSTPVDRNLAYLAPAALRAWAAGTTPTREDDMPTAAEVAKAVWEYQLDNPRTEGTQYEQAKGVLWWAGADAAQANATIKGQAAAIEVLASKVGTGEDAAQIIDALNTAIANAVVKVAVSVSNTTQKES